MKLRNLKASFILKDKVSSLPKKKNYSFKQDTFTFNIYSSHKTSTATAEINDGSHGASTLS